MPVYFSLNFLSICPFSWLRQRTHGRCQQSAVDAHSSMTPGLLQRSLIALIWTIFLIPNCRRIFLRFPFLITFPNHNIISNYDLFTDMTLGAWRVRPVGRWCLLPLGTSPYLYILRCPCLLCSCSDFFFGLLILITDFDHCPLSPPVIQLHSGA